MGTETQIASKNFAVGERVVCRGFAPWEGEVGTVTDANVGQEAVYVLFDGDRHPTRSRWKENGGADALWSASVLREHLEPITQAGGIADLYPGEDERVRRVLQAVAYENDNRAHARRMKSVEVFGHPGASIPTLPYSMSHAEIVGLTLALVRGPVRENHRGVKLDAD